MIRKPLQDLNKDIIHRQFPDYFLNILIDPYLEDDPISPGTQSEHTADFS